MTKKLSLILAIIALLPCTFCSAPHDNPFDPTLSGTLQGWVVDRQGNGIEGAGISLAPVNIDETTDDRGQFKVYSLPPDQILIRCRHSLYASESLSCRLERGRIDSVYFALNGLPKLVSGKITTFHWVRSWPLDDLYFCTTEAAIDDPDGMADVDSVTLSVPQLALRAGLDYDQHRRTYSHTIWAESLPGGQLEILSGKPFHLQARDQLGAVDSSGPHYISRIVYPVPKTLFPRGWQDTVPATFTLVWTKFREGYGASYALEIVHIETNRVAYSHQSFSIDDTSHLLLFPLAPGNYYWTIAVRDEFGNTARDKETAFVVRP